MTNQWTSTWQAPTTEGTLLDRAQQHCVQRGSACDTGHLLVAALLHPEFAGHAGNVLTQFDGPLRERVIGGLQYLLDEHPAPATHYGELTVQLQQCVADWQQQIASAPPYTVDAIMLRTILTNDDRLSRLLQVYHINTQQLVSELSTPYVAPRPTPAPNWSWTTSAPSKPSLPQVDPETYVLPVAQRLTKLYPPSQSLIYRGMHTHRVAAFLDELAGAVQTGKIVMLSGRNGSPAAMYPHILADRIAAKLNAAQSFPTQGEPFTGGQAPLNDYSGVYHFNLRQACEQAVIPDMPKPYRILELAMQYAVQHKAILLLEEPDVLAKQSDVSEAVCEPVRGVLNRAPDGLVFALNITQGDQTPDFLQDWGLSNVTPFRVHHYTADHTRESIKRHYLPLWENVGYTFAPDAFEWVFALEPGAWVNSKRETLPYLAVDLAIEAIRTAAAGDGAIHDTAQSALEAINQLQGTEALQVPAATRDQYGHILLDARRELQRLVSHPAPMARNGRKQLARANLAAQLLCRVRFEFHYPGSGVTPLGRP